MWEYDLDWIDEIHTRKYNKTCNNNYIQKCIVQKKETNQNGS